jgi:hypothetical protein
MLGKRDRRDPGALIFATKPNFGLETRFGHNPTVSAARDALDRFPMKLRSVLAGWSLATRHTSLVTFLESVSRESKRIGRKAVMCGASPSLSAAEGSAIHGRRPLSII